VNYVGLDLGWNESTIHDQLTRIAERVEVGHPGHLRLIFKSKRKCDRLDAEKLAKLLFLDEVPRIYVPAAELRSWRSMIEHRTGLVNDRSSVKTQVRAQLRSHGIRAPRNLWTRKGTAWLQALDFEVGIDAIRRDTFLERLKSLGAMIKRVEEELAKVSSTHPGRRFGAVPR
jgi:transposase